jgi:hypothetical protein
MATIESVAKMVLSRCCKMTKAIKKHITIFSLFILIQGAAGMARILIVKAAF